MMYGYSGELIISRDIYGNYLIKGYVSGVTDGETPYTRYMWYSKRKAVRKWRTDNGAIHKRLYVYDNTKN